MIVSSFSVLFCSFQVQFFSFIRQFFSDWLQFTSMYFIVSRPRIAGVLCFLRWTEQIAYLFFYFNLSKKKKNCNMFARLVGHHPRIMFCLIVFSFAILLCFLLQYSCTIFSFSLVGFKPFFPFFCSLDSFSFPTTSCQSFMFHQTGWKNEKSS